jgi:hypothetical protein
VILNNNNNLDNADTKDKAEGASSDINTKYIKRDASLHDPFITLELASALIEPINASGPWYNIKEGRYIKEPLVPGLRPYKQYSVPSIPV